MNEYMCASFMYAMYCMYACMYSEYRKKYTIR